MPTLNIKDERVYALAHELATARGTSMTAVIRQALEREAAAGRPSREGMVEALMAISARTAPKLAHLPADPSADLYDEATGLPR